MERWQGRMHPWPLDHAALESHYDRVAEVLLAQPYPTEYEPYASTPKTVAFQQAAAASGLETEHPPLAVEFGAGPGPPQPGRAAAARRQPARAPLGTAAD